MLRTRVRSWPGPPSSFHPTFSESEGHSAWFDKLKLTIPQDSTLTTSDTTLRETLNGLSTDDPECDSASLSTNYEDALTHISDETLPRISIGSVDPSRTGHCDIHDEGASTNNSGPSNDYMDAQAAPSTPAPMRPAPEPRMIPAKQRLTALERMKSLNIRSSIQLTADESVQFSSEDEKILDQFIFVLSTDWIRVLRNLRLPMFIPCLVSVTDHSNPPKPLGTYICIKGLLREKHIRAFHSVVSQRAVRRHYAPLKICYDTRLIRYAASEDGPGGVDNTVINPETLCGRVLRTKREDGSEYLTTIGGLIAYGDSRYIMTSSDHHEDSRGPDSSETDSMGSESSSTDSDDDWYSVPTTATLSEEEFDDDVEGPLLCDLGKIEADGQGGTREPGARKALAGLGVHDVGEVLQLDSPGIRDSDNENSHWRLIPAPNDLAACNYISVPAGVLGASMTTGYIQGHRACGDIKPDTPVAINAGLSGVSGGSIVGGPSYLFSNGKLQQVWTIKLRPGTNLQRGDSGSWVLDTSLKVVGSVLAISDGSAYMVSFEEQLKQITAVLKHVDAVHCGSPVKAEVASSSITLRRHPIDRIDLDGTVTREDTLPAVDQSMQHTSSRGDPLVPPDSGATSTCSPNVAAQRPGNVKSGKWRTLSDLDLEDEAYYSFISREGLSQLISSANERRHIPPEPRRAELLGLFTIACLILNRTIGSGIFTHPTDVLDFAGNPGLAPILWVVALVVTWAIMISWVELGTCVPIYPIQTQVFKYGDGRGISIPRSSGEFNYADPILTRSLFTTRKLMMLISVLLRFVIHYTAITSNALQFGIQMQSIASGYNEKNGLSISGKAVAITLWAFLALAACLVPNILSRRFGIWLNNAFAIAKVMILVAIFWTGHIKDTGERNRPAHHTSLETPTDEARSTLLKFQSIPKGLSFALYAYGGLEAALILAHTNIRYPNRRKLAKQAFAAAGTILFLYPLANIVFYSLIPLGSSAGSLDVVSNFLEGLFGAVLEDPSAAEYALACLLAFSALGNIFSMTWTAFEVQGRRVRSIRRGFGVLPHTNCWSFLGLSLRRSEIAKEGILSLNLLWATGTQRYADSDALLKRINQLWSHPWCPALATGLLFLPPIPAGPLFGCTTLSRSGILSLMIAYTSTIIPAILLAGCVLHMRSSSWRATGSGLEKLSSGGGAPVTPTSPLSMRQSFSNRYRQLLPSWLGWGKYGMLRQRYITPVPDPGMATASVEVEIREDEGPERKSIPLEGMPTTGGMKRFTVYLFTVASIFVVPSVLFSCTTAPVIELQTVYSFGYMVALLIISIFGVLGLAVDLAMPSGKGFLGTLG